MFPLGISVGIGQRVGRKLRPVVMAFVVQRQLHDHETRIGVEPSGFIELNLFAIKMICESHGCHWDNSSWNPCCLQPGTVCARIIT